MVKKVKTNKKRSKKKVAWFITGVITTVIILGSIFSCALDAKAANGYSTLPGWSGGYRYYFDMDEDEKSKLRLFGKYKQVSGNTIKFGWDRQTGKDINQFDSNVDDDGIIFFEQEFKF
jgi:hypothetical protein